MTFFKSQIQALWGIKAQLEETLFELQDMEHEDSNAAAKLLDDAFELINEAIDLLAP